jgi:hypothetical protein
MRVSDEVLKENLELQQDLLKKVPLDEQNQEPAWCEGPEYIEILSDLLDARALLREVRKNYNETYRLYSYTWIEGMLPKIDAAIGEGKE